eukprot:6547713-Alexandrium_andersonii.AAC.1
MCIRDRGSSVQRSAPSPTARSGARARRRNAARTVLGLAPSALLEAVDGLVRAAQHETALGLVRRGPGSCCRGAARGGSRNGHDCQAAVSGQCRAARRAR